jgi:SagB-type dehydrogenase family enzyme
MTTSQSIDAGIAQQFNDATKLQYINLSNKPPLYKTYPGLRAIPLPDVAATSGLEMPTLEAIGHSPGSIGSGPLSLETLANLLYHAAAVIRRRNLRDGEVHYRAAASAGALYPTEVYVVCGNLDGLRAGVYHFNPRDFTLARLRNGDLRRWLGAAAGDHAAYSATLVFTTLFWRSAWKYRERGYRYCYWDLGTIAANLLAAGNAAATSVNLRFGFVDRLISGFLGLDGHDEAPALLATIGTPDGTLPAGSGDVPGPLPEESNDLFSGAVEYPLSRELHRASLLRTREEVPAWNDASSNQASLDREELDGTGENFRPLKSGTDGAYDGATDLSGNASTSLGDCIRFRGSTRRFAAEPITWEAFRAIVNAAGSGINSPHFASGFSPYLSVYFIVNAVDGLAPGAYYYNGFYNGLRALQTGDFRETAGHLGFEQALPADASAVAFITADLALIEQAFGPRGYRMAQTIAGIIGGRIYLAAHSVGLGATGLTFFDDAVADFFAPHANGHEAVFVVPIGVPHSDNRVRPFRSRLAVSLDARARGAGQAE